MMGKCKWFDKRKGFGFLTSPNPEIDYFVHQTGIVGDGFRKLEEDQPVRYIVGEADDGRAIALNVTLIDCQ